MPNALEIPEILRHVGAFLQEKHLFNCIQVCKFWCHSLTPVLYHTCAILCIYNKRPSLQTINKYASWIRELTFDERLDQSDFALECSNLTSLTIQAVLDNCPPDVLAHILQLIQRNSNTLTRVSLKYKSTSSSKELWSALLRCPRMKYIKVDDVPIPSQDMKLFWEVCSKVKALELNYSNPSFSTMNSDMATTMARFLRLQDLSINFRGSWAALDEITFISNAPNLVTLTLHSDGLDRPSMERYRRFMLQKKCPRLEEISVLGDVMDDDIALTLNAMTNAKKLDVRMGFFSEKSYRSLTSRHSTTIREFICQRSGYPTSAMIQQIMCSCPSLEVLHVCSLDCTELARIEEVVSGDGEEVETVEKIVLGDNWVCLGLKSLTTAFTVSKSGKRLDSVYTTRVERQRKLEQEHAFRQLSRLSRLKALNISHHSSNHDTLDVRLESRGGGLEGLASLKSLEQFLFYGTSPDVSEDDINWMVEHWPRLRVMFGRFSYDFVESYILQSYAEEKLSQRNG